MVLVDAGVNRVRDLVYDDITIGMLGTGSTAVALSDTALATSVAATSLALNSKTKSDKMNVYKYVLQSTTGTGNTYKEFGLFNASGTMFSRTLFTGQTHTSTDDLHVDYRHFFRRI